MDDYQYKTINIPAKNQGLFGYGGNPNRNGIGYSGMVIDSSRGFYSGIGGGVGPDGEIGATGPIGNSGALPSNANYGDMLYYDGSKWVKLDAPINPEAGLLVIKDYTPQWLHIDRSSFLMYIESQKAWVPIYDPSQEPGIRVLTILNGGISWIEAGNCIV